MSEASGKKWHLERLRKGEVVGGGYIVFRRGTGTGRIKVSPDKLPFEHDTIEKATNEAMRLAAANKGVAFCVMHQVVEVREGDDDQ